MKGATIVAGDDGSYIEVSIHAPVKGATCLWLACLWIFASFNPRAREGRDCPIQLYLPLYACFNPRAREGRDTTSQ